MEANSKKSPEMLEKIIQGKLTKRMNELSLLGQNHMVEPDAGNIDKFLKSKNFSVLNFAKWTVGGSV
jgi:translation elongation factor EF-Ts